MSGAAAVAAALRDIQASPLRPSSRSLGTRTENLAKRAGDARFAMGQQKSELPPARRSLIVQGPVGVMRSRRPWRRYEPNGLW